MHNTNSIQNSTNNKIDRWVHRDKMRVRIPLYLRSVQGFPGRMAVSDCDTYMYIHTHFFRYYTSARPRYLDVFRFSFLDFQ